MRMLAEGCLGRGAKFFVAGDSKSPPQFDLPGCEFLSLAAQREMDSTYARLCPERSYTRKNIAYLSAIRGGAELIIETDDDNFPKGGFWADRHRQVNGDGVQEPGWVNAYAGFSDRFIYPRGLPLQVAQGTWERGLQRTPLEASCPIQQSLADRNPDVDAVYRMLYPLPFDFRQERPLILSRGQWCPFNSQNTTFFQEVFPLLYLPAHCSFRMTDIWRSFVAQRIAWEFGWSVSFHSATVYQERNEHDLLRDFEEEIPGYLHNQKIIETLEQTPLSTDPLDIFHNLTDCYAALMRLGVVGIGEEALLEAWINDLSDR